MRGPIVGVVVLAAALSSSGSAPPLPRDDKLVIQAMRIEGTIPARDDPYFNVNPYRTDVGPYASVTGQFTGGDFCVIVVKDRARGVVWLQANDKTIKEQAAKLAGRRVVVECKGEVLLSSWTQDVYERNYWTKRAFAGSKLVLTAVRVEPAK